MRFWSGDQSDQSDQGDQNNIDRDPVRSDDSSGVVGAVTLDPHFSISRLARDYGPGLKTFWRILKENVPSTPHQHVSRAKWGRFPGRSHFLVTYF